MNTNVEIILKTNKKDTDEYKSALFIKEYFSNTLPKEAIGKITILTSITLFGQKVKDLDIVILGMLNNCSIDVMFADDNQAEAMHSVKVYNFCAVLEVKSHSFEGVKREGTEIYVRYGSDWHSATYQSNQQIHALKNYFESRMHEAPYINNFIWLKSMTKLEVKELLDDNGLVVKSNLLPSEFSFSDFIQRICDSFPPYKNKNADYRIDSLYNCASSVDDFSKSINFFTSAKQAMGELTRTKVEQLTKNLIGRDSHIGQAMGVYRGRAGTGKTHRLLQTAIDVALNDDKRALILTYNNALVSDIRRILAFAEIPDGINPRCVSITTIHKFIYQLLLSLGLISNGDPSFLDKYEELTLELKEYLEGEVIKTQDIKNLILKNYYELSWGCVLIDEAQDFSEAERDILVKIYGSKNIVVADGTDQLVRAKSYCDWPKNENRNIIKLKECLRQKSNLVDFVNNYAKKCGMDQFLLKSAKQMTGGKIIITTKPYINSGLHLEELEKNKQAGNSNYDYLFLTPPQMVSKVDIDGLQHRAFSLLHTFKQNGIELWDGTSTDLRTEYPVNLKECRIVQYDSCRGLEGWTVVCLSFDKFIEYKANSFNYETDVDNFRLETPEAQRKRYINSWALIPMTRAIDTLIITLEDKDSETGIILKRLYNEHPDYISWI